MLSSLAFTLVTGGGHVTDVDQLHAAPTLFGSVASAATISRFMSRVNDQPEAFAYGFATMQRTLRSKLRSVAGKRTP